MPSFTKFMFKAVKRVFSTNDWKKFVNPTVVRGGTIWPKSEKEQEEVGIRFDYDGEVETDEGTRIKIQIQPNRGNIPTKISNWMKRNGATTHAVMATIYVLKNGNMEDLRKAMEEGFAKIVEDGKN
ncbi:hypothetical protein HDK77DRAFT_500897 [Phyllosticta capitalensis]